MNCTDYMCKCINAEVEFVEMCQRMVPGVRSYKAVLTVED